MQLPRQGVNIPQAVTSGKKLFISRPQSMRMAHGTWLHCLFWSGSSYAGAEVLSSSDVYEFVGDTLTR